MANLWKDLENPDAPEIVWAVIEIPAGSSNKYEYDKEMGVLSLDRVLPGPHRYPINYGFIPQTYYDDGDALDIMVISTYPLLPGSILKVKPIGMLRMIDSDQRDDKILAVPVDDFSHNNVKSLNDANPHLIKMITYFMEHYKDMQGKKVTTDGWKDVETAKKAILHGIKTFEERSK